MFSRVKVDYSIRSKELGNDITISGCYAIYTRKSIFHKWKQQQTFADLKMAEYDAIQISKAILPKYY